MKDGKTLRDMYQFAVEYIREKKPDLEKNFVKNLGSGVRPYYSVWCNIGRS